MSSLHTITQTPGLTPDAFVSALQVTASESPAVRHYLFEYLARLDRGRCRAALRLLFGEYYHYSSRFTQYLAAVTASLSSAEHRAALVLNSAEESGALGEVETAALATAGVSPAVAGVPHPVLFRRFLDAIDVAVDAPPHLATACWVDEFRAVCSCGDERTAVGALGPGTEGVVAALYQQLLALIRYAWPDMLAEDRAFFELHAVVDDDHAEVLHHIAVSLARTDDDRRAIARGVQRALSCRRVFFDAMLDVVSDAEVVLS